MIVHLILRDGVVIGVFDNKRSAINFARSRPWNHYSNTPVPAPWNETMPEEEWEYRGDILERVEFAVQS